MPRGGRASFLIYAGAAAASHRERPQAMRWLVGLSLLTALLALISPAPVMFRLLSFLPVLLFHLGRRHGLHGRPRT